jgi:hypothetical protein
MKYFVVVFSHGIFGENRIIDSLGSERPFTQPDGLYESDVTEAISSALEHEDGSIKAAELSSANSRGGRIQYNLPTRRLRGFKRFRVNHGLRVVQLIEI